MKRLATLTLHLTYRDYWNTSREERERSEHKVNRLICGVMTAALGLYIEIGAGVAFADSFDPTITISDDAMARAEMTSLVPSVPAGPAGAEDKLIEPSSIPIVQPTIGSIPEPIAAGDFEPGSTIDYYLEENALAPNQNGTLVIIISPSV